MTQAEHQPRSAANRSGRSRFFVTSGLRFDLNALFASASTVARVPLFLLAIYVVRGLPAIVYRLLGRSRSVIAGVLQATSLTFTVAATQIGVQLGGQPGQRRRSRGRRASLGSDLTGVSACAAPPRAAGHSFELVCSTIARDRWVMRTVGVLPFALR